MEKNKLNNAHLINTIMVFVFVCVLAAMYFIYQISGEVYKMENRVVEVNQEIASITNALDLKENLDLEKRLIKQEEISLVVDELTSVGGLFAINFLSITPKEIEVFDDVFYNVLPIELNVQSKFKDLAKFLGDMNHLEESIVVVKNFEIQRNEENFPLVKSSILLEVYIQDGKIQERK